VVGQRYIDWKLIKTQTAQDPGFSKGREVTSTLGLQNPATGHIYRMFKFENWNLTENWLH